MTPNVQQNEQKSKPKTAETPPKHNGQARSAPDNLRATAPARRSFGPAFVSGSVLPEVKTNAKTANHAFINELNSIVSDYCELYYDTVKNRLYKVNKPQYVTQRISDIVERYKVETSMGKADIISINKTFAVLGKEPLNDKEKSFVKLLIKKKYATKENINAAIVQTFNPKTDANGQRISKTPIEWTNGDFSTVLIKAKNAYGKVVSQDALSALLSSNHIPKLNPIIDFYEKQREKYPRDPELIDKFISCIETDTPNPRNLIKIWLSGFGALVAKEKHPPRTALVFTGPQNTGKTQTLRSILPDELMAYFAESTFDREKDDELLLCQNLLVLNDEWMGKTAKSDPEKLKSLISKSAFHMRVPYGKTNETFTRLAMIAGTSNQREILNDPTGNSRIIPINVLGIDFDKINTIDRNHLFCEIVDLYLSGHRYMLNEQDRKDLEHISLLHTTANVTREMIEKYFDKVSDEEYEKWKDMTIDERNKRYQMIDVFTSTDVMNDLHRLHPKLNLNVTNLGRELMDFTKQVRNVKNNRNKTVSKGYVLAHSTLWINAVNVGNNLN